MALLEGDERSEMPSMSWNSVVKRRTARTVSNPSDDGGSDAADVAPPPPPPPEPVSFSTSSLTVAETASASQVPAPPTPAALAPETSIAPLAPVTPVAPVPPIPPIAPIAPVAPSAVPTPPPAVSPESTLGSAGVIGDTDLLAQPGNSVTGAVDSSPAPAVAAPAAQVAPVVEPAPAVPAPAPAVAAPAPVGVAPGAAGPNQSLNLPAASPVVPTHRVAKAPQPTQRKPRKDRSGSVARVGFFFMIVAAVASAAVIFGRPYLFPADWEPNALEFAEPIEDARGSDFIEPVLLVPQPSAVHRDMVAAQLLGDPASNLAMWRALGLAGPDSTDDDTLDALISEQSPVLYSTADGQVYYDASFTRSDRAALISRAMATAALDQEFSFSTEAQNRSLDDAALTEANVAQQAALIAEAAAERGALQTTDMAALSFLPAVLDYRITAPVVFADLLPPVNDVASNPLADLGLQGPGPLRVPPLAQIPSNSATIGDTATGEAIITDRSFWYMSFASHLDATVAYRMSNQLRSAGLQMVDSQAGRCAVATFSTADAATNAALQADLDGWVAATAPELGATVSTLPDGNVQLRSCDPPGAYTSNIRFGVSRQLIAWRSVELAVTNLVVAQGGTAADITAAIAQVDATPSAVAVAQLPAGTAPADLANAAQAAANDVIATAAIAADSPVPGEQGDVDPAATGEG